MKKLLLMILILGSLVYGCSNEANPQEGTSSDSSLNQETDFEEPVTEEESSSQEETPSEPKVLMPNYTMINHDRFWGFSDVDHMESFLIEPVYQWVTAFNANGYAIVASNSGYGIIDQTGQLVLTMDHYEEIRLFQDYFLGRKDGITEIFLVPGQVLDQYEGFSNYYVYKDQLVVTGEGLWILDTDLNQLVALDQYEEYLLSDLSAMNYKSDIKAVFDEASESFHYEKEGNKISEDYNLVAGFDDGLSIVGRWMTGDYEYLYTYVYGLIDEKGQEVLPLEYTYIDYLGDGYYAFSRLSSLSEEDLYLARYGDMAYKKGIWKGQVVSDEAFFTITYMGEGRFHVNDGSGFRFMTAAGKEILTAVTLNADYTFQKSGDLLVGLYGDNRIFLYDDLLVEDDFLFSFDSGYLTNVEANCGSIRWSYPVIHTLDPAVEARINDGIASDWTMPSYEGVDVFYETMDSDYEAVVEDHRLIISESGFYYGYGAAHGNYGERTVHYDLRTGQALTLEDLFQDDPYQVIPELLADYPYESPYFYEDLSLMSREDRIAYFTMSDYNFTLKDNLLEIYFNPYDIAPYAAGIIRFYFDLETLDVLDRTGPFFE